jgi:PAS domain S-box-containing protein
MKNGYFDPDRVIAFLNAESQQALDSGYTALRITGERDWVERSLPGSAKLMEYEARLNRDVLPQFPCLGICQYDIRKLDVELIKGLIVTHPKLIRGGRVYSNFYFLTPEAYFSTTRSEKEIQLIFKSIELEDRLERSLCKTENRYSSVFENTSDAIFIIDVTPEGNFKIVSSNPASQKLIRLPVSDISGVPVEECFPKDVSIALKANCNRCISTGNTIKYTETLDIADKTYCFNTILTPLIDSKGHIYQIISIAEDITGHKD